jgi:CDP-glucose 4,6-dehydratase
MRNLFGRAFEGRRVLLTGHTGFKGSWLAIWLRELGAEVIGYSRDSGITPRNFELSRLRDKVFHVRGDVLDAGRLQETIERYEPEAVLHLAAQPIVKLSYQDPQATCATNAMGTVNVLDAVRQGRSVRTFLGVTTDKVYQDVKWLWGYRENDPLGGYDPYSASKAMAELAVAAYRSSWGEPGFAARPVAIATARGGNVIGGGDFAPYRLVPDCMRSLMAGEAVALRNPHSVRPWQHVLELLSGYLWLAANLLREAEGRPGGNEGAESFSEAWNFGPSEQETVTCEDLVRKAVELWRGGSYHVAEEARKQHETGELKLNWTKAAVRLGWRPTYDWQEGMGAIVRWFKEYQAQERSQGTSDIDMYACCVDQIEEYVACARERSATWAT